MEDRIGTCSECGGAVVSPRYSDFPTPHCIRCGAISVASRLPVIPMERPGTRPSERGTSYGGWRKEDIPSHIGDTLRDFNTGGRIL